MTIQSSSIRLPSGLFSVLVTPVNKDGVTQLITPVDANGNVITGGGGTPGGSDTQVQFNDAGAFGGDPGLTYNKTTDTLTAGTLTSALFRSANSGNVPFVATPSGTGAFQLQQTDNTVTGGNARGTNAVDLQMLRSAASQVASGTNSFLSGITSTVAGGYSASFGADNNITSAASLSITSGQFNTLTNNYTSAFGYQNTVSGESSFALGQFCTASGIYSGAFGFNAINKGVQGLFVFGTRSNATTTQLNIITLGRQTTDATPSILITGVPPVSGTKQLALLDDSSITFTALVTATTTAAGDCKSWEFKGQIQRGSGVATTALVAAVTPSVIAAKAGASTWNIAVTADTTNGCLAVTATGQAATTISWSCSIFASEVRV